MCLVDLEKGNGYIYGSCSKNKKEKIRMGYGVYHLQYDLHDTVCGDHTLSGSQYFGNIIK